MVNGVFQNCKVRLCAMGNQQKEGIHFKKTELYAPVMKATEARTFLAIVPSMDSGFLGQIPSRRS